MPVQPMRALRCFILDGVKQSAIVRCPGDTRNALESLGKRGRCAQVSDLQHILSETRGVGRISEQLIVFADFKRLHREKGMTFGEGV